VISVLVAPAKGDIISYLRAKLDEDETLDAMDDSLEADIMEKILENISEMCVAAMVPRTPHYLLIDIFKCFYSFP